MWINSKEKSCKTIIKNVYIRMNKEIIIFYFFAILKIMFIVDKTLITEMQLMVIIFSLYYTQLCNECPIVWKEIIIEKIIFMVNNFLHVFQSKAYICTCIYMFSVLLT